MLRLSHHYCGQAYPSKGLSQNPSPSRLRASSPIGLPDFREAPEPATGFPRLSLLRDSVNKGNPAPRHWLSLIMLASDAREADNKSSKRIFLRSAARRATPS